MLEKTQKIIQTYNEYLLRNKSHYVSKRARALKHLGGKCVNCGNDDLEVLEGDHLYNNRKSCQILDLIKLYNKNMLESEHIQLLCRNCHRKKTNIWHSLKALERANIPPF